MSPLVLIIGIVVVVIIAAVVIAAYAVLFYATSTSLRITRAYACVIVVAICAVYQVSIADTASSGVVNNEESRVSEVIVVIVAGIFIGGWLGDGFGAAAGAVLAWLVDRSLQQARTIATLQAAHATAKQILQPRLFLLRCSTKNAAAHITASAKRTRPGSISTSLWRMPMKE